MTENVQNPGSGAFFASAKSGQFMCYRTGQIYLLPTLDSDTRFQFAELD